MRVLFIFTLLSVFPNAWADSTCYSLYMRVGHEQDPAQICMNEGKSKNAGEVIASVSLYDIHKNLLDQFPIAGTADNPTYRGIDVGTFVYYTGKGKLYSVTIDSSGWRSVIGLSVRSLEDDSIQLSPEFDSPVVDPNQGQCRFHQCI